MADLTGWEATAAAILVSRIDNLLPASWTRHDDGPGMWRWERTDEDDNGWIVAVNGRDDRVLVPAHGWPARVGPTVMAARRGDPFVSVTLPHVSDSSNSWWALAILAHVVTELSDAADG